MESKETRRGGEEEEEEEEEIKARQGEKEERKTA